MKLLAGRRVLLLSMVSLLIGDPRIKSARCFSSPYSSLRRLASATRCSARRRRFVDPTAESKSTEISAAPSVDREHFLRDTLRVVAVVVSGGLGIPPADTSPEAAAHASNLPPSNGADLSKTGSVSSLVPLLQVQGDLQDARSVLLRSSSAARTDDDNLRRALRILTSSGVPYDDEAGFKRLFDEYSDPVSYKQKFLDQNAFLVYYTRGFDGPGRPNIEADDPASTRQTVQYGARNDAWTAVEETMAELKYAAVAEKGGKLTEEDREESRGIVSGSVDRALAAMERYLKTAPEADLEEARRQSLSSSSPS